MICAYLDSLDGSPAFAHPPGDAGWESRRLEALARSPLDGLCVWGRELYRPADERSPTIIEHERQRSRQIVQRSGSTSVLPFAIALKSVGALTGQYG